MKPAYFLISDERKSGIRIEFRIKERGKCQSGKMEAEIFDIK